MPPYPQLLDADLRARLASQLEAIPRILAGISPAALTQRPSASKWSAQQNLAHLACYQEMFEERLNRILAEDRPALARYRAEDDPAWPRFEALSTPEVLGRLTSKRTALVGRLDRLDSKDLLRIGVHPAFGPLPLPQWIEFFLLHEAHHLYTVMLRLHGV
jgi:DinB family protein